MKVLILGGSGMLGHKLWQIFAPRFDAYVTFRDQPAAYSRFGIFDGSRAIGGLTAANIDGFAGTVRDLSPEVVVNCIGVVKQDAAARDPVASIETNALFPHRMARICRAASARFIHLSTDCVFSGRNGSYAEEDSPDAPDFYGRSKLLGEVEGENELTIRTSMIGRELKGAHGLLEWFLSQEGERVRGFRRAVFSGLTTGALAEVLAKIICEHRDLKGIRHVASEAINKLDLLTLVKQTYGLSIEIEPDEAFVCDRSLDGSRFYRETGIRAPSWSEMIAALRADPTPYNEIRRVNGP